MIKFADNTMIPHLKRIWQECFGDGEEYIDMYFSGRFKKGRCLVYIENESPCAMLVIYDAKIRSGGQYRPVSYIYGVATLPEYQGRGISTKLLEYARKIIADEGSFSVLAPASEELIEFYKKRGYYASFFVKQAKWDVTESNPNVKISEISAKEYKRLRDERFDREGYVCWDDDIIEYALHENDFCGGRVCRISIDNSDYAVMYYVNDDVLHVQETTLLPEVMEDALNCLAKAENCRSVSARLCADSILDGEIRVFAMTDAKLENNGYMNIVFD